MNPKIEGISIVLVGQFNPVIFQPAWLAINNLVREEEANEESVKVIHPELTHLDMGWLKILVERNRFQASTVQAAYYAPLRDLVLGVFTLLSHTPITAVGINRDLHYGLDQQRIERIISDLAALTKWAEIIDRPSLSKITMSSKRPAPYSGYVQVEVEQSIRLLEMDTIGLHFHINGHYELGLPDDRPGSHERLRTILEEKWDETLSNSMAIASRILGVGS